MSRKDPPRGPKALREPSPGRSSAASPHSSSPTFSTTKTNGPVGSRPPTAPRGLSNGPSSSSSSSTPKTNGHSDVGRYFDVPQIPAGPAALKAKLSQSGNAPPTGPRRIVIPLTSNTNGTNSGKDVGKISFDYSAPPPPSYDPPPPPPPAYDPPPPPPPTSEPPVEPPAPPPPLPAPEAPVETPLADVRIPSPSPPPPPRSPTPPPPVETSVPLPPEWPPPASELAHHHTYKVVFDPFMDKDYDGKWKDLIDSVRRQFPPDHIPPRIKSGSKGRESLLRYEGEHFQGAPEIEISDPRQRPAFERPRTLRPGRDNFYEVKYEYDANSVGPPPATSVLISNISPLTSTMQLRRHFEGYGIIKSFEPQIDMETGGPLGVVFIRFSDHEEAKKCVENEHGKKNVFGLGLSGPVRVTDKPEETLKAVFDGNGSILRGFQKGLEERRKREREEKRRREKEKVSSPKVQASSSSTPLSTLPPKPASTWSAGTPSSSTPAPPAPSSAPLNPPPPRPHPSLPPPPHIGLPPNPTSWSKPQPPPRSHSPVQAPAPPSSRQPDVSMHAEPMNPHIRRSVHSSSSSRPSSSKGGSTYIPSYREKPRPLRDWERDHRPRDRRYDRAPPERNHRRDLSPDDRHWSPSSYVPGYSRRRHFSPRRSRSPSPSMPARSSHDRAQGILHEYLARNGHEYIRIDGGVQFSDSVEEDDVRAAFVGFKVDKVYKDRTGWFVTFNSSDGARRAQMVLSTGTKRIANHTVEITIHSAPTPRHAFARSYWSDNELISEARAIICKELISLLERDISEHIVEVEVARIAEAQQQKWRLDAAVATGALEKNQLGEKKYTGLSFKKRKTKPDEPPPLPPPRPAQAPEPEPEPEPEESEEERPTKRQRTSEPIADMDVDPPQVESHSPTPIPPVVTEDAVSIEQVVLQDILPDQEPIKKKSRTTKVKAPKKTSETPPAETIVDTFLDVEPIQIEIRGSPSPSPTPAPILSEPPIPVDPIPSELLMDDEDMYFARLALSKVDGVGTDPSSSEKEMVSPQHPPVRRHATGSARTEGFYTISHTEKASYVDQYQTRTNPVDEHATSVEPKHVVSSRSNRANARRRAQGLEEHHQLQLAVALSKGETTTGDVSYKFNQLQTRKKHLRFARSPIHDWGLYAMEKISRGEMVIEYVGEVIRAQVADKREKAYERQGIGSSYLFRIDEDLVVDATKKGNLGRLINHSCDPNCTAKIITIQGVKKIVIYAKQDIELGDEITYDYHFPIEQDKIPCLCGSAKCRGYLN